LVRKNIHEAFSYLSSQPLGALQILDSKVFEKMIGKLESERLDIQEFILFSCYNCIRLGNSLYMPAVALKANALQVFITIAGTSSVPQVQTAACDCIMMLW
jgi:hypothetical protein